MIKISKFNRKLLTRSNALWGQQLQRTIPLNQNSLYFSLFEMKQLKRRIKYFDLPVLLNYYSFLQLTVRVKMKALNQSHNATTSEEPQQEHLMKKLIELQNLNKQKQSTILKYQQTIKSLEEQNQALDEELETHEKEWKQLEVKIEEEKNESEDEEQMNNWIESVQKYNGLSQTAIDSLCSMEFEGGEQQICLSCYQELSVGSMCTYLPCCHLFHKDCIENHLKVNKMCPACQEVVNL